MDSTSDVYRIGIVLCIYVYMYIVQEHGNVCIIEGASSALLCRFTNA